MSEFQAPKYSTIIQLVSEQGQTYYLAEHPELEGCMSEGETPEEASANLQEVTAMLIEHLRENNLPIPRPQPIMRPPREVSEQRAVPTRGIPAEPTRMLVQPMQR